jgi:hypothetical protein
MRAKEIREVRVGSSYRALILALILVRVARMRSYHAPLREIPS